MPSSKKSAYKHKKMPNIETDNKLLNKNLSALPRLKDIYDEKTTDIPDDYQIIILSFERLYKGIYQELQRMGAPIPYVTEEEFNLGKKDSDGNHRHPHYFKTYAREINQLIPLAENRDVYFNILDNITERFQPRYSSSRFAEDIPFEEFQKDFRRLETQTYRLLKGLEQYREKYHTIEEEKDIEIDDWS